MAFAFNDTLIVDEDLLTSTNDLDEIAAGGVDGGASGTFTPNNTALTTALGALTTSTALSSPQIAVQAFTSIDDNTTGLRFSTHGGTTAPTAFPTWSASAPTRIDSGLKTLTGDTIYLWQSSSEDLVYGATATSGTALFAIALDEHVSGSTGLVDSAQLWILLYSPVQHGVNTLVDGADLLTLAGSTLYVAETTFTSVPFSDFSDVPSSAPIFAMIAPDTAGFGDVDILVTAYNAGAGGISEVSTPPITVNVSTNGLASGSQNITYGTGLRFDIVNGGVNTYTRSQAKDANFIQFQDHKTVNEASFTVVQNQGSRPTDLKIEIFDVKSTTANTADGTSFFDDISLVNSPKAITKLVVERPGLTSWDSSVAGDHDHFLWDTAGTQVIGVKGLSLNYEVEIFSSAGFDRFSATNVTMTTNKQGQSVPDTNATVDLGDITFSTNDSSTNAIDVGAQIKVEDSVPSIGTTGSVGTLDVYDAGLANGSDSSAATNDTLNVAGNFTSTAGSDGLDTFNFALSLGGSTDSGLDDALSGQNIFLKSVDSTHIEGRTQTGNDLVFDISIANNGTITFDLDRPILHGTGTTDSTISMLAAEIQVDATIKDKDGDTAVAHLQIGNDFIFHDDVPSVSVTNATIPDLTVHDALLDTDNDTFSVLFNPKYGADGAATGGGIAYTLAPLSANVASGVYDVMSGQQVLLKQGANTHTVVGYVTLSGVQTTVFTVAVDSSGGVSLALSRAIQHPTSTDPVTLASNNLITLTATVTDKDLDTAHTSVDIGTHLKFYDATPVITLTDPDGSGGPLTTTTVDMTAATTTLTRNFTYSFNNDTPGSIAITDLTHTNNPYYSVQANAGEVDFYSDSAHTHLVYKLTATYTGGAGSYTITVVNPPQPTPIPLDFGAVSAGGPKDILYVPIGTSTDVMAFDGKINHNGVWADNYPSSDADDINPDNIGFGVKSGQASQINPGEAFVFGRFASNLSTHEPIDRLDFSVAGIGNLNTITANFILYDSSGAEVGHGHVDLTGIKTTNGTVRIDDTYLQPSSGPHTGANEAFDHALVWFTGWPQKQGVDDASAGIRLSNFNVFDIQPVPQDTFSFDLTATDGDNDVFTTSTITVTLFE